MLPVTPARLEKLVSDALDGFYARRLKSLDGLKLKKVLKRKTPYLYKATGCSVASDIVGELLKAYVTSSDEGIFGDAFFESVALAVSGGHKSLTGSVDIEVHSAQGIKAYAVKSGPSVFNAQSKAKQNQAFEECRKRLLSMRKHFDPIVGYCYGSKKTKNTQNNFREVAGQAFWEDLTGDADFYLKLVTLMGDKPNKHFSEFTEAYSSALNRFVRDFTNEFCLADGTVDWEKLVRFNSGKK